MFDYKYGFSLLIWLDTETVPLGGTVASYPPFLTKLDDAPLKEFKGGF